MSYYHAMRVLADQVKVDALIGRLALQIGQLVASTQGAQEVKGLSSPWAMVGIRSRGDILAARLVEKIKNQVGHDVFAGRVGAVDITLYRDDLSEIGAQPVVRTTEIPFNVDGMNVVLVDDVLMTGRSVRAALQSIMDLGRPKRVWLAVLVDRGSRELPIAPDGVGWDLTNEDIGLTSADRVEVKLKPTDTEDTILAQSAMKQLSGGN